MKTCYFDTETMGLYGPAVILQAQFGDDKPFIHDLWNSTVSATRGVISRIVECRAVAHNLTFDWQKISQFYNAATALERQFGPSTRPIYHLANMSDVIYNARQDFCLKPPAAVCTLLLCQKQIGGASLATKEIRVRKIPADVAPFVADLLNKHTDLPEIMFARRQPGDRWVTALSDEGEEWLDVALRFAPSNALKDIARLVLGEEDTQKIGGEIQTPEFPYECGYAPYAKMLDEGDGFTTVDRRRSNGDKFQVRLPLWPRRLRDHLKFWTTPDTPQERYALDDIRLLRKLDEHLGCVATDFDSELSCQVASVRVAGFEIDPAKLEREIRSSTKAVESAEVNVDSHVQVRKYVSEALDPMEALVVADGCDKAKLKSIQRTFVLDEREVCCKSGCPRCGGTGFVGPGPMPVVDRAGHILNVRKHRKRKQLYDKLAVSKGAFPSFRVIGTKSGRMSGADGLNYHGIDGSREIREIFTLAEPGWVVCGGDMNSQELAIAAQVMNDSNLEADIAKGKSLHGVFAAEASGLPYEQIMRHKEDKTTAEANWYKKAKICVYAILYGAASFNISLTLGCDVDEAEETIQKFFKKYPYMAEVRRAVRESLTCVRSDPDGRMTVSQPNQDYVDSVFGYRRSFKCEFSVANILFQTMKSLSTPAVKTRMEMFDSNRKVIRKDTKGPQPIKAAIASALYGAIFSVQGKIVRAALNHHIQSAGRTCTLRVQKRIWDDVQPVGIHPFLVKLLSVHDEIITTSAPENAIKIEKAVVSEMESLCETVPLLSLDWASNVGSWYGCKAAVPTLEGMNEEDRESAVLADRFVRCGWEG